MTTQQNTELQDAINNAKAAYEQATGKWDDCDWCQLFPHSPEDGEEQYDAQVVDQDDVDKAETKTDRRNARKALRYRESVQSAASDAEDFAKSAMAEIEAGNYDCAARYAQDAAGLERQFGDAPVWGDFADAVQALADLA